MGRLESRPCSAFNLLHSPIFQMNMSTVFGLHLMLSLGRSAVCEFSIVQVRPGTMQMRVCVVGRHNFILGSKDARIIVFLNVIVAVLVSVLKIKLE